MSQHPGLGDSLGILYESCNPMLHMQYDIVTGGLHLHQHIALHMAGNLCLLRNDGYSKT